LRLSLEDERIFEREERVVRSYTSEDPDWVPVSVAIVFCCGWVVCWRVGRERQDGCVVSVTRCSHMHENLDSKLSQKSRKVDTLMHKSLSQQKLKEAENLMIVQSTFMGENQTKSLHPKSLPIYVCHTD